MKLNLSVKVLLAYILLSHIPQIKSNPEDLAPRASDEVLKEVRKAVVDKHNDFRKRHVKVSNVAEDPEITEVAQAYAEKIISKKLGLKHSSGKYGENLYAASGGAGLGKNLKRWAVDAVNDWYKEICHYNHDKGKVTTSNGHYTQLLWAKSTKIGIGIATNEKKSYIAVVVNYSPAGNVAGSFNEKNLPRSDCKNVLKYCKKKVPEYCAKGLVLGGGIGSGNNIRISVFNLGLNCVMASIIRMKLFG